MRVKYLAIPLMLLFLVSMVTPLTNMVTQNTEESLSYAPETKQTLAQGEIETMKIPIFADEAVVENSPDTNYDHNTYRGGLFVGYEPSDGMTRSWLMFDLSGVPDGVVITSAALRAYMGFEYNWTEDAAVGAYYSSNSTWTEDTITWNNQPTLAASPTSSISGEIVNKTWYEWEVTPDVQTTLDGDKILTEVLRQVDEGLEIETWKYFTEAAYDRWNATYLLLEYMTPVTEDIAVDGQTTAPLIDYIQSATPEFSWLMSDSLDDMQRSYEIEVWDNEFYNDTLMWDFSPSSELQSINPSGATTNTRPFGLPYNEMRYQLKYDSSQLSRSGVLDKIAFAMSNDTGTIAFENLEILLASSYNATDLDVNFATNLNNSYQSVVLHRDYYEAEIIDGYLEFDLEDIFFSSDNYHLIVELRFTNSSGDVGQTLHSSGLAGSAAYSYGTDAYTTNTAVHIYDRTHNVKLYYTDDEVYPGSSLTGNNFPFKTDIGAPGIFQIKYNSSMIKQAGLIDRIFIQSTVLSAETVYENFTLRLVETPVLGALSYSDFESNFGGVTPTIVVDEALYTVRVEGGFAILEFSDTFYYSGEHDLLIDFRFDSRVSGGFAVLRTFDAGGYRAYNVTYGTVEAAANDTRTYNLNIQFYYEDSTDVYDGTPLVNATQYFWRVRTMDSTGIWSPWATQSFNYTVLTSTPDWTNLEFDPDPGVEGSQIVVSLDVTHMLGIESVTFEFGGVNHTMTPTGDTYSYSWVASGNGNFTYTIYMESSIGTWSETSGIIEIVESSGFPIDTNTLILIAAGVLALIVIIIIVRKRGS